MPDGERYMLTRDGLADLARYLVGVRQWIAAAASCMEDGR